jgi:trehalose-phosphatase
VREADGTFIFTDFDGTLIPIVGRPEQAHLPESIKDLLLNLSQRKDISVAIISGRSMADIQSCVGVEGIFYAGNHGLEIVGPGLKFIHPGINIEDIKRIKEGLSLIVQDISGVILEDKGLSLSLHFRQVEENDLPRLNRIFFNFATPLRKEGRINIGQGKKVYDVKPPVDWDKGKAMEFILRRVDKKLYLPLYLGDDLTDEDGFKMAQDKGGVGILVGDNALSSAEYCLSDVGEVEAFLAKIWQLKG